MTVGEPTGRANNTHDGTFVATARHALSLQWRHMNAILYTTYGPPEVLRPAEAEIPAPKDRHILVRVNATHVSYGDLVARNFGNISPREFTMPLPLWMASSLHFGLGSPKVHILGSEFAGEVAAVGASVSRFKVGERVFGYTGMAMGTYAEFVCVREDGFVAPLPRCSTSPEACAIPYGALMALGLLRRAPIQTGHKVLINGASGSIGSAAVQLAKHFGAEVTGVCSTQRLGYVRALGADAVVDYTVEDFTQNGERYDLILDVLGKSSYARCKGSLTEDGRYLLASFKTRQLLEMASTAIGNTQKVICALVNEKPADMATIHDLVEVGVLRAIIDRCYPLAQAAEAHRYAESGQRTGAIVLTTSHAA